MSSGSNSVSNRTDAGPKRESNNVDNASDVESEEDGTFAWKVDMRKPQRLER